MTTKTTWMFTLTVLAVLMLSFGIGCDGKGTPREAADSPAEPAADDSAETPADAPAETPADEPEVDTPDEPEDEPTPVPVPAGVDDDVRTIMISKAQFSEIYPAVWFSPSTGEIVELVEESDEPPAPKFECWVEPRDPEFAFADEDGVGFAGFGEGDDKFEMDPPAIDDLEGNLRDVIGRNPDPDALAGQPVFYVKGKLGDCMIQILKWDPENQVIEFKWRSLD
jgi:hypothetical protein